MSIELILMPILSMISGIAALFIDPKDRRSKWAKPLMLILLAISATATILFGYQKEKESHSKDLKYQQDIHDLKEQNNKLQQDIVDTPRKTVELLRYGYTSSSASKATSEQISQSRAANVKLNSEVKVLSTQRKIDRQTTTVQYFPKDIDSVILRSTLESLGFNLEIRKPRILDIPTNAIWFGSKAKIEDVKLVAYTLIRAGVQLKSIKLFREETSESRNSLIQVGADRNSVDLPVLTVEEIRNTSKFPRN